MRITQLTLSNFRCFGPAPTTIQLQNLTTLVGANGAGKTAVLLALCRLFGTSSDDRRIRRGDFHLRPDQTPESVETAGLSIEARITFPELAAGADASTAGVPDCFRHMLIDAEGTDPYCRVRLEATWTASGLPEGEITERTTWLDSVALDPPEDQRHAMQPHERTRIQVLYVPAARDPASELRNASGTLLARMLRGLDWPAETRTAVAENARESNEQLSKHEGVAQIEDALTRRWSALYDGRWASEPRFRFARGRLEEILRQVELVFGPATEGEPQDAARLSDGLQSLFYFALVGALFDLERENVRATTAAGAARAAGAEPASRVRLTPPALTIFAVEEPEAHLAPHQLGRIMRLFNTIVGDPAAQVVLTSHAPAILRRVDAKAVRFVRLDPTSLTASVRALRMPDDRDTAAKFVREAVQAHPELYFARAVVLGEGASEDVVLPRVARAHSIDIDPEFVSVVPLGGRHVNHFWRLLTDLEVPFVTLLDLDRERAGAGWGRIKYVIEQLLANGADPDRVLMDPTRGTLLGADELKLMHERDVTKTADLEKWTAHLETFGVFFSAPLDLDFLMLEAFSTVYTALATEGGGPPAVMLKDLTARAEADVDAAKSALGAKATAVTYTEPQKSLFPWYVYLFLNRSKPATHLAALATLEDPALQAAVPPVLARLIAALQNALAPPAGTAR